MLFLRAFPGLRRLFLNSLLGLGVLLGWSSAVGAQATAYLDHAELTDALRELAESSGNVSMSTLATSPEGREVWLLEIAAPGEPTPDSRPGVLVVGNLEGDHVVGSHLVLEVARYLASGDEPIEPLLADHVFYLVPRLNPDGAEATFADVLADRGLNGRPVDDDNDGRIDEDPPEDLNGDGLVTMMRVPDPVGRLVPDPAEPRLMLEADPARSRVGEFTVYWEGLDSDGDGFLNEDGAGGVNLNRNFQHAYPYYTAGAGPHMVSEPETRGLMDFVIAHRNIGAILTFGHTDNLVTPPDQQGELAEARTLSLVSWADASNDEVFQAGVFSADSPVGALDLRGVQPGADNDPESGRRPAATVNEADLEYFAEASELYRAITGIERVGLNRAAEGAFFQYGYFQYGVPSFSTQGWALPGPAADSEADGGGDPAAADADADVAATDTAATDTAAAGAAPGADADDRRAPEAPEAELLSALEEAGIDAFVDWSEFEHPELGPVEIGGFRPFAATNPPPEVLPELGRLHGEFVAELARMLPRIQVASVEVESHGGGLFTITAQVENQGFFPSALRHGVIAGAVDPVTVRIGVPPEDLLTGDPLTARIDQLEGSGTRQEFNWLIRGEAGESVEIRARSQNAGTDVVTVTLEEA